MWGNLDKEHKRPPVRLCKTPNSTGLLSYYVGQARFPPLFDRKCASARSSAEIRGVINDIAFVHVYIHLRHCFATKKTGKETSLSKQWVEFGAYANDNLLLVLYPEPLWENILSKSTNNAPEPSA